MTGQPSLIAWVDVETTGLDARADRLLQLACIVTDHDYTELADPLEVVVRHERLWPDRDLRELRGLDDTSLLPAHTVEGAFCLANRYVQDMHLDTGLWDRLSGGQAMPLPDADAALSGLLRGLRGGDRQYRLGGNSCRLDLDVVEAQLPVSAGSFHHRMVDVTSLSIELEHYGLPPRVDAPVVAGDKHDAVVDIRTCLAEARWRRGLVRSMLSEQAMRRAVLASR